VSATTERSLTRAKQIAERRRSMGTDKLMAALMDAAESGDMELLGMIQHLDQRVKYLEDALITIGKAERVTATESGIILSK
jgi:hypothetical protein